ncbi:hypothetical protein IJG93_02975, partial [Candidatus Saccharibacteria bacterium]|nr:hypothetical protein [Candidatus Saccharibacteria bacterium]
MRSPEFSSSFEEFNDNQENLTDTNDRYSDEVERTKMRIEEEERQKELILKQHELEERLRALGVDPEPIIKKAREDYLAKKARVAKNTAKVEENKKTESAPAPAP